jgi:hypothetical protein
LTIGSRPSEGHQRPFAAVEEAVLHLESDISPAGVVLRASQHDDGLAVEPELQVLRDPGP